MNLTSLIQWCLGIILAFSAVRHIDEIHRSILKAQGALLYQSRTAGWGSPRFLQQQK